MNDSLFDTMQIKLEDARDREEASIMVGLAPYMELSEWMDKELVKLRLEFHDFETAKSHRLSDWAKVVPNS
ncbi:hypothetical protein [Bremerella cremea]|uniref:hypothetical protein n=1 Tax=Bremerella cremea TaxID=1031537 RepID=UPI0031EFF2A7